MSPTQFVSVGVVTGAFMVLGSIAYLQAAEPSMPRTTSACENTRGAYVIYPRGEDEPQALCVWGKRAWFVRIR